MPPPGSDTRRAAVLIPIIVEGEDARVVYTVRKDHLADHAGQISFPGGSIEARDGSLLETALREAEEEIDLSPELVEVAGALEEMYIPPSNFRVSPFVGASAARCRDGSGPRRGRGDLHGFSGDADRQRDVPQDALAPRGPRLRGSCVRNRSRNIWGATAAMTAALLAAPWLAGIQALGAACCG